MEWFTSTLDFYSVFAALILAIQGPQKLAKGKSNYDVRHNEQRSTWNRIYWGALYSAFGTAALSWIIKVAIPFIRWLWSI